MALSKQNLISSYNTLYEISNTFNLVPDIKYYIMQLLIDLYTLPYVTANDDGFTIKTRTELLILMGHIDSFYLDFDLKSFKNDENPKLKKYDLKNIKVKKCVNSRDLSTKVGDKFIWEECVIKNVNTVSLLQTGRGYHCMIIKSTNNKLFVSSYLALGNIWWDDTPLAGQIDNLIKLKFHKGGIVSSYSCSQNAFFVIVDGLLYVIGKISLDVDEVTNVPTHIPLPKGEIAISIKCVRTYAHLLTNNGSLYAIQTQGGLKVNKIDVPEIKSIRLYGTMSYLLTTDGCMIVYNLETSKIHHESIQVGVHDKAMKISCTITEIFVSTSDGKLFSIGHNNHDITYSKFQQTKFVDVTDFECGSNGTVIITKHHVYHKGIEINDEHKKLLDL